MKRIAVLTIALCCAASIGSAAQEPATVYHWKVEETLSVKAKAAHTVNGLNSKVVLEFASRPATEASLNYNLVISSTPDELRLDSVVPVAGHDGRFLKQRVATTFSRNVIESLDFTSAKIDSPVQQLLVSAVNGDPGSIRSPFLEGPEFSPELLVFLANRNFKSLHALPETQAGASSPDVIVKEIRLEDLQSGLGKDVSFLRRYEMHIDPVSKRPQSITETSPSHPEFLISVTAENWREHAGIEVPDKVVMNFKGASQERRKVFTLVSVKKGEPLKFSLPLNLRVLDYRTQGKNLSNVDRAQLQPVFYGWTGSLPPLSSLAPASAPKTEQKFGVLFQYLLPVLLIVTGVTLMMKFRTKS